MKKEISLKDLQTIDPTGDSYGDETGILARAALRRKRDSGSEGGPIGEEDNKFVVIYKMTALSKPKEEPFDNLEIAKRYLANIKNKNGSGFIKVKRREMALADSEDVENIDEALTMMQRIKRRIIMRKNKAKIAAGVRRAKRRRPTRAVFIKRANRAARTLLFKKLAGGRSKADLTYSERVRIEKLLAQKASTIQRLSRKLLPIIIKKDRERRSVPKQ